MAIDEAVIFGHDENGDIHKKGVSQARKIFDFPESFPEAYKDGAQIRTGNVIYWYDKRGNLQHCENRYDDY